MSHENVGKGWQLADVWCILMGSELSDTKQGSPAMHTSNAVVTSASIQIDRECFLCVWLHVDHEGGSSQGFGGWVIGGTPEANAGKHEEQTNLAAEFIVGVMRACDVEKFSDCVGKAVRVMREDDSWGAAIIGIGHIIKNDRWFNAKERMAAMAKL